MLPAESFVSQVLLAHKDNLLTLNGMKRVIYPEMRGSPRDYHLRQQLTRIAVMT